MPSPSSSTSPNSANSRPRNRSHASLTVMCAPNTARPTTTVSMPLSTTPDSALMRPAAMVGKNMRTASEADWASICQGPACP